MSTEIFLKRSIDELPEVKGSYLTSHGLLTFNGKHWEIRGWPYPILYWLEPTTLENLLAQRPELVEKIFEAARELELQEVPYQKQKDWDYKFDAAQDYINSLKTT